MCCLDLLPRAVKKEEAEEIKKKMSQPDLVLQWKEIKPGPELKLDLKEAKDANAPEPGV